MSIISWDIVVAKSNLTSISGNKPEKKVVISYYTDESVSCDSHRLSLWGRTTWMRSPLLFWKKIDSVSGLHVTYRNLGVTWYHQSSWFENGKVTPNDHPSLDYSKYSLHVSKNHLFKCVQNILKGRIYSKAWKVAMDFKKTNADSLQCIVHLCQIFVIRLSVSMLSFVYNLFWF